MVSKTNFVYKANWQYNNYTFQIIDFYIDLKVMVLIATNFRQNKPEIYNCIGTDCIEDLGDANAGFLITHSSETPAKIWIDFSNN